MLIFVSLKDGGVRVDYLPKGACTEDWTFGWTDDINTFTRQNTWFRDLVVIFNSFCFDMTMLSLLYLYWSNMFHTLSDFLILGLCAGLKAFVQETMFAFEQPQGFNWYWPGLYSLMVPYHDVSDFFFSGHIASGLSMTMATYRLKCRHPESALLNLWFKFWLFFKLAYIWWMMTINRTHFLIDLTAGAAVYGVLIRVSEKLVFIFDVRMKGLKAKDRGLIFYEPCPVCGWANETPLQHIDKDEKL